MADKDTPKVNFSFSQFEDTAPEPFVYMTKANKRVTFPDIFDEEAEVAEKFLMDMRDPNRSDTENLKQWLTEKDYEALQADRLTMRHRQQLIVSAIAHYEKSWGTPGEDSASAS